MGLDAGLMHPKNQRIQQKKRCMESDANHNPYQSYLRILRSKRQTLHRHLEVASILSIARLELAQELEPSQYLYQTRSNY